MRRTFAQLHPAEVRAIQGAWFLRPYTPFNFFAWAQRLDTTPGDIALAIREQQRSEAA